MTNQHSRVITFKYLGATNYKGSRLAVHDMWHDQRVYLPLSGADSMLTLKEFLTDRGFTIASYGYLAHSTDKGVILVNEFDIRLKDT